MTAQAARTQRDLLIRLFSTVEANGNLAEGDRNWAWREYQRLTAIIDRLSVSEQARRIALQVLTDPALGSSDEALKAIRLGQRDDLPVLQAIERALRTGRAEA